MENSKNIADVLEPPKPKPDELETVISDIINSVDLISKTCDYHIYQSDWKLTWKLVLFYTDSAIFWIFAYCSIKATWGDIPLTCFGFVTCAFGVQDWQRLLLWTSNQNLLQDLHQRTYAYARRYDKSTEESQISLKYLKTFKKLIKIIFGYLGFGGPFIVLLSILEYLFTGDMVLPFQYTIPGLNSTDHPGFELNLLFQTIQTYTTCTLLVINWYIYLFPIISILHQVEIIKLKLSRLNELILIKTIHAEFDSQLDTERSLIDLVKLHINLDEFIEDTESLQSQSIFIDCILYMFACVMVIFIETLEFYGPGIIILVVNLATIFLICMIGTIVQIKLENLQCSIYDINWYDLPISEKRIYLMLLIKSIKCDRLTSGGIKPLNLELYISIMKSIYSYTLTLQEFYNPVQ